MAVDSQYLWILPQALEFTPDFKKELDVLTQQGWKASPWKQVGPLVSTDKERVAEPWLWKYHLSSLIESHSQPRGYSNTLQHYIDEDMLEFKDGDWTKRAVSATEYTEMKRCLLSLQHVGLDCQGGMKRLYEVYRECRPHGWIFSRKPFPTASIIVIDPQEAKKYFQIGIHLTKVSASLSNYSTKDPLDQAMKVYSMIKELVQGHSQQKMPTEAELDASISATTDENLLWEYKREKFRLAAVRKYRDIIIQKAVEENEKEKASLNKRRKIDA